MVRVPDLSIGEEAARVILQRRTTKGRGGRVVDLGFEIVRRMTA